MKTTAKDIILLCKGWYDKEKYPTILDAIKQYYRKNYCEDMEEYLNESFLLKTVMLQVMQEIAEKYKDRIYGFINRYLLSSELLLMLPDTDNSDYDYVMFYRIICFCRNLKMRGDGVEEIDTSEYFVDETYNFVDSVTKENLQFHKNRKCLKEDII